MQQPWKNAHFQGRFVGRNAPAYHDVGVKIGIVNYTLCVTFAFSFFVAISQLIYTTPCSLPFANFRRPFR
jgi:hypothetical protein